MILALVITNKGGNVLLERYAGVPSEERGQWRAYLVKLGSENLRHAREEEPLVASHRSVYIVYMFCGEVCLFAVGNDEDDELGLVETLGALVASFKDVCKKAPTESSFLSHYGKISLCIDEILAQGVLEQNDKDRVRRLIKLKPIAD